jgi:phage portal protein BeeE
LASEIARRESLVERVAAARRQPSWYSWQISEARAAAQPPVRALQRAGVEYGIPDGGLTEYNQGIGAATQTDRRSMMQQLFEAYVACPWAWACVNAIARTITAGGLVMDWDSDAGEGDQDEPEKPENVLALERLLAYVNPEEDIRQLMRNVIVDLLVFGDAFIEVVWWGSQPVALYSLDSASMMPLADKHGTVTGYVQLTDFGQRAEFEPRDVIHISMDAPRGGVFGISPTQAALLPITAWLFAASTGKEMFRKGLPAQIHADFPAGTSAPEMNRWSAQYSSRHIGPRNLGVPIMTKGGAKLAELQAGKVKDVLEFLDQKRDEIISDYGCYPAKVGVIESGNLGGGTGESQDKGFRVNTCAPTAELVLEKFNFAVTRNGFGIEGWKVKFRDIDWRDSLVIEQIRDMRLRNGAWILDKYRADIGEPPVPGGDQAVLVDRQNIVVWADIPAMSKAMVAAKGAPAYAAGEPGFGGPQQPGQQQPDGQKDDGKPGESLRAVQWQRYRARLAEAQAQRRPAAALEAYRAELGDLAE